MPDRHESLLTLRDHLAAGRLMALQAVQDYIAKIRRDNPAINAVVVLDEIRAMARARELDRALKETGRPTGPLHGVPFTIKDAFRIEGFRSSFGWPGARLFKAHDSCTIVTKLLEAGAIPLGLTNVPFACFDWQCDSPVYGTTKSPFDPARTPGGSSGGSAAALAAGFTPFEIGSDLGGSIRYPAHCCGVYGLRPTHDFVRFDDVGPAIHKRTFQHFGVAGPMARSLADLELVLEVISDYRSLPDASGTLRFGYATGWLETEMEDEAKEKFMAAVDGLRAAGHAVEQAMPDIDMGEALDLWGQVVGRELVDLAPAPFRIRPMARLLNLFMNRRKFERGRLSQGLERGILGGASNAHRAHERVAELAAQFDAFMARFDAWLTPCSPGPAILRAPSGTPVAYRGRKKDYADYLGTFNCPVTIFGHPILSAPIGLAMGLPMNIQIHGRRNRDAELLRSARSLRPSL